MTLLKKIDSQGNYSKFPGVTVIAKAGNKNKQLWVDIYNFINRSVTLRQYYTPLPYQSYHMTTCDLYTQAAHLDDWPTFISQNMTFFQQLHAKLAEMQFLPAVTIEQVTVFNALQLNLSLPAEQYRIIKTIADTFGLNDKIPKKFHITLAYQYQDFANDAVVKTITEETKKLMAFCKEAKEKLILTAPKLCFFHNMGEFTSWNGITNPFNDKHDK